MKDQHYDPFTEEKKSLFRRKGKAPEGDEKIDAENGQDARPQAVGEETRASKETKAFSDVWEESAAETVESTEGERTADTADETVFETDASQKAAPSTPTGGYRRRKYPVSAMVSAGFWLRAISFLIDVAVASAFSAIFTSPLNALFAMDGTLLSKGLSGFFFYLYFILSTYFTNGQTLGKIITATRVIHPEEPRLSLTTVIVREGFCRFIQTTFLPLYVITAFAERKRNLGDFLSDTYVVKDALYTVEKNEGDLFYAYE